MPKAIIICVLVAMGIHLAAQNQDAINKSMPKPVPPSPNVAALGKFGDYPVGYFSGLPEISIPIFEVKSGNLSVPITLSYHASGIKPTDVSSWVGMGWSLSAGGQVSVNVNGKPDDQYYYSNSLNPSPSVCTTYQYLKNSASNVSDTEPDVFSYSFPGKSGKFMLRPNGANTNQTPYLIPYAPIVVKRVNGDQYEITDEQGVLYRFGKNSLNAFATEGTTATNGGNPGLVATTAWHLMEMISPNSNDNISFNYVSNGTAYTKDISYALTVYDQCMAIEDCPANQTQVPQLLNVESFTNQQALSSIVFETGRVDFILSSNPRTDYLASGGKSLSQIRIWSKANGVYVLQKTINFVYSYFKDAGNSNDALKLDEVQFLDNTSSIVQRYKLSYFTNSFSWNRSNTGHLNARDLWGYYNGAAQNSNLILKQSILTTIGGTTNTLVFGGALDRKVNPSYVKEGVLSRIDFPTGGYTQFDYEPNQYLDKTTATPVPTLAGGLRLIKTISNSDGIMPPIVKTYKYGYGESGYGVENFTKFQFNYFSTQQYYFDCPQAGAPRSYQIRTYFSNSAYSQDAFDASPVRYRFVTEYAGDFSGNNNGKTIYSYDERSAEIENGLVDSSPSDINIVVPNSSKYYRNSYFWSRGKLTSKKIYNTSNQIVASTTTHYKLLQETNTLVGHGVWQYITGNNACAGGACLNEVGDVVNQNTYFYNAYFQSSGVLVEDAVTEVVYETGSTTNFVSTSTTRTIDPVKIQVLEEKTNKSNSTEALVTNFTYPFQLFSNSSSTNEAQGIYMLNSKNVLSVPIEKVTMLQNTDGSNQRVLSAQVTSFRANPANTNQVVPGLIYFFESPTPIPKTSYSAVTINGTNNGLIMNSNLKSRISFDSYDGDGNLLTATKTGDISSSYIYGYSNSLPIAEVSNANSSEIRAQNFEDLGTSSTVIKSTLAHSGNQYYQGDYLMSFTIPNARAYIIDYWYLDTSNKWQYISKSYTGASMMLTEGSAIDDVRIYPKDAQISTYTYDPLIGKTSDMDINGRMTFYEYDAFGRLKWIRDTDKNILKAYSYQYILKQ